jgi:hypothetical protein
VDRVRSVIFLTCCMLISYRKRFVVQIRAQIGIRTSCFAPLYSCLPEVSGDRNLLHMLCNGNNGLFGVAEGIRRLLSRIHLDYCLRGSWNHLIECDLLDLPGFNLQLQIEFQLLRSLLNVSEACQGYFHVLIHPLFLLCYAVKS